MTESSEALGSWMSAYAFLAVTDGSMYYVMSARFVAMAAVLY